ncbi:MAG: glycosyltransferase [Nocardioides sp.]
MTRVSVIVPVYNHERFIVEALRSVIDQTHPDIELICIDDGSRDASLLALADIAVDAGRDIKIVPQSNAGAHSALNAGLALATGDLVMFLNSDDVYALTRVSTFVRAYERLGAPDEFWGFSRVGFVDDDGNEVEPAELGTGHLSHYTMHASQGGWSPELLAWHNVALTSGNLVATLGLMRRVGGFSDYAMVHDWDMALRLLALAEPLVVPLPLYVYRLHGSNSFKSIAREQAVRESEAARERFAASVLRRTTEQPLAVAGTPFVDYMRLAFPLIAPFTS